RMQARLRTDSASTLRALVENGAGISMLDEFSAADALAAGRLERVLANWSAPVGGVYAVTPPGRHAPPLVRAFVAFYRAQFAGSHA
ncbi:MAG TPA: LysR substrate-binding domain-containing protein, partial [Tahibacter sp.]|nr:LysR substrate-binding domain-containing protein [Tahibacter sp.]